MYNKYSSIIAHCFSKKPQLDNKKFMVTERADGFLVIKRLIIIDVSFGSCLMLGCSTRVSSCLTRVESVVQHMALSIFLLCADWLCGRRVKFHAKFHSDWAP